MTEPVTFKVGDGATYRLWTDEHAGTIIWVSPNGKRVRWQQDKAIRTNREKDTFSPGGFVGHTECPEGQEYVYERDPDGHVVDFSLRRNGIWKRSGQSFKSPGGVLTPGKHEYYDYNF